MVMMGKRHSGVAVALWWGILAIAMVSAGYAQDASPTLTELLDQAAQLRLEGKWDEAIGKLQEAVDRRAEDEAMAAEAQLRIGRYRLSMAKPAEAETELRRVAADFPAQTERVGASRVTLVDALMFQGLFTPALDEATSVAANQDYSPGIRAWAQLRAAELRQQNGNTDEALSLLDGMSAFGLTPETATPIARGMTRRAEILMKRRERSEAVSLLEQAIATAPSDDHDTQRRELLWSCGGVNLLC